MKRYMVYPAILVLMFLSASVKAAASGHCGGKDMYHSGHGSHGDAKDSEHSNHAKQIQSKEQTICPVKGDNINRDLYRDCNGKRIYFCCEDCTKVFEKDPVKYTDRLIAMGVEAEKSPESPIAAEKKAEKKKGKQQDICPVMWGNPVNKNIYVDYNGKRVYFCCNMCPASFKKDPDRYIKKLEKEGITLENVPIVKKEGKKQTICPVIWGNPINKNIYVDYKGKRIYMCCKGCPKIFNKDPEKYIKKLEAEGYILKDVPASKDNK